MFIAAGRMFFLLCYVLCTPYSLHPTSSLVPTVLRDFKALKTLRTLETLQSSSLAVFEVNKVNAFLCGESN